MLRIRGEPVEGMLKLLVEEEAAGHSGRPVSGRDGAHGSRGLFSVTRGSYVPSR